MTSILQYDPPGGIGLYDPGAVFRIRFDETDAALRPQDATRAVEDFEPFTSFNGFDFAASMPVVVDAALGRGRRFGGTHALFARDIESGTTLMSRDMTAMAVLSWLPALQPAGAGCVIARGLGEVAPEQAAFACCLEVVDAPSRQARLRWGWEQIGVGALVLSAGVVTGIPEGFTLVTWTRRWISPTEVVLRYYVADRLVGEELVTNGDIGGSTTGTLQIGAKADGSDGTLGSFFGGIVDELMLLDRVVGQVEIEDQWRRMAVWQPLGVQALQENLDPGFPVTSDRYSGVQADLRLIGQALGFAGGRVENFRENFLPHRAYGDTLAQWAEVVATTSQPGLDEETVRRRTLARFRQRKGSAIPGMEEILADLVDGGVGDLQYVVFTNTIRDEFTTLSPLVWQLRPDQATSWTVLSGKASTTLPIGDTAFNGAIDSVWRRGRRTIQGSAREANLIAKVSHATATPGLEVGIYFEDQVTGNYLLLGVRNDAGTYRLVSESWVGRASQGVVQHAVLAGGADIWLWLRQLETRGTWRGAFSITSETAGYTETADITHPTAAQWCGFYARSHATLAGLGTAQVEYTLLRQQYGVRPFCGYVLLDEGLGYDPDISAARAAVRTISQAHIHTAFIVTKTTMCDDPTTPCDLGPMGAL